MIWILSTGSVLDHFDHKPLLINGGLLLAAYEGSVLDWVKG